VEVVVKGIQQEWIMVLMKEDDPLIATSGAVYALCRRQVK
jgi:hypothetical protein